MVVLVLQWHTVCKVARQRQKLRRDFCAARGVLPSAIPHSHDSDWCRFIIHEQENLGFLLISGSHGDHSGVPLPPNPWKTMCMAVGLPRSIVRPSRCHASLRTGLRYRFGTGRDDGVVGTFALPP
jgi:hypothetical protein